MPGIVFADEQTQTAIVVTIAAALAIGSALFDWWYRRRHYLKRGQ